jgi:hypothetical protein
MLGSLIFNTADIEAALPALGIKTLVAARTVMQMAGAKGENYAKSGAPWTDRTGNARRSIHFEFSETIDKMSTSIGIGVTYGVFLELSHGGKYRIIGPTMHNVQYEMIRDLQSIMKL